MKALSIGKIDEETDQKSGEILLKFSINSPYGIRKSVRRRSSNA
jgi:hypothetical protein